MAANSEKWVRRPNPPHNQPWLVRSPAKLNLFLEVTGRRADGFHQLETVMVRTDLCDTLQFSARDDAVIELTLAGDHGKSADHIPCSPVGSDDFPLDESNLIVQAAQALQQHAEGQRGVSIRVHKRIPGRAGLGGGSGNAAVTLRTLNQLWELDLPEAILHDIAAGLGSDVNFLLSGCRAALCRGRGELIHPLAVAGLQHGLLIVPESGNSTAAVFQALELPSQVHTADRLISVLRSDRSSTPGHHCFNRLQTVAGQLNPDVQDALNWLSDHAGGGSMTGSGSACFALLNTAAEARRLAGRFAGRHSRTTTFRF